jgi:hypothetical protein
MLLTVMTSDTLYHLLGPAIHIPNHRRGHVPPCVQQSVHRSLQ